MNLMIINFETWGCAHGHAYTAVYLNETVAQEEHP